MSKQRSEPDCVQVWTKSKAKSELLYKATAKQVDLFCSARSIVLVRDSRLYALFWARITITHTRCTRKNTQRWTRFKTTPHRVYMRVYSCLFAGYYIHLVVGRSVIEMRFTHCIVITSFWINIKVIGRFGCLIFWSQLPDLVEEYLQMDMDAAQRAVYANWYYRVYIHNLGYVLLFVVLVRIDEDWAGGLYNNKPTSVWGLVKHLQISNICVIKC